MLKVFAKKDCGCCSTEMYFTDTASADAAFEKAGLGNGRSITDDRGTVHTGLDSFYGYSVDEPNKRGLGDLWDLAGA